MRVELSSGVLVDGLRYERQRISGKLVLRLRSSSGLRIVRPSGGVQRVSRDEFSELVQMAMTHVSVRDGARLDAIHVDLALVEPILIEALEAGRLLQRDRNAPVRTQDAELGGVMLEAIRMDPSIKELCSSIGRLSQECGRFAVQMDPVPLRPDRSGATWGELKELPDLGLVVDAMWFSINLSGQAAER